MRLFEFTLTFESGRVVRLYFLATDPDAAMENVWDRAIQQGHDPRKIKGLELTWQEEQGK